MAAAAPDGQQRAGLGYDFVNVEIPQILPPTTSCTTLEEYKRIITTIYSTLRAREWPDEVAGEAGNQGRYVASRFCNLTNADFRDRIRTSHPTMADARNTALWLYRLLKLAEEPPRLTRNQLATIVPDLADQPLNDELRTMYHAATDADENVSLPVEYVHRWAMEALDGLIYTHEKARRGFEFQKLYDKYMFEIDELQGKVGNLLASFTDRNTVNAYATQVATTLSQMQAACENYVKLKEPQRIRNAYLAFQEFREITRYDFLQQRTQYTTNILWLNHLTLADTETFSFRSVETINTNSALLFPLVKDIRGFQPTARDIAQDKAARVKAANLDLKEKIDNFLDNDNVEARTLAKAKLLFGMLKALSEKCNDLKIDGIQYDVDTVGVDPAIMESYYVELSNYIEEEEEHKEKRKHRDRLEANEILKTSPSIQLPALNNVTDWLNFKAALDRIMPFHSNDMVKSTLVRKALRDKADINRCKNLTYTAIMSYLNTRYNDSSLIPRLVDRLLSMKEASNYQISYENLTEFLSIWAQLELHKGQDRIDSFAREKLVDILLPSGLRDDFLMLQLNQESQWKEDELKESIEDDDDASTTFSLAQGEEFEEKRRDHFVKRMKAYSEIVRRRVATMTPKKNENNQKKNQTPLNNTSQRDHQCPACNTSQCGRFGKPAKSLAFCGKFKAMPVKERFDLVNKLKFCKKCIADKSSHDGEKCRYRVQTDGKCTICNRESHHELLHLTNEKKKPPNKRRNNRSSNKRTTNNSSNNEGETVNVSTVTINPTNHASVQVTDTQTDKKFQHMATRMFLSPCTYITVKQPDQNVAVVLGLLDIGAGLNFCLQKTAKTLHLQKLRTWCGTISTVNGDKKGDFDVYLVPVKDISGKTHKIAAVALDFIGHKTPIPDDLFTRLCKTFKVNPNLVQNTSGEIEILIGVESQELLANPSEIHGKIARQEDFPGVQLYNTILSPSYLLVGAVGPTMADNVDIVTRMHNVTTAQCLLTLVPFDNEEGHSAEGHTQVSNVFFQQDHQGNGTQMLQVSTKLPDIVHEDFNTTSSMALLNIKKTAATLNHLDAGALPDLCCPACLLMVQKCGSCKMINNEASLRDLEELAIIKANMKKIPDPDNDSKFFIFFDYVFKEDPHKLYAAKLSNKSLAKKSAARLRIRLLRENLMDSFQAEMDKSIKNNHFAEVTGELKDKFDALNIANYINFNYVMKPSSLTQGCRPVSDSTAYHPSGDLNSKLLAGIQSINNPLHIIWKFLWGPVGWAADYSRAYRSVITGDISNAVRRFFWYKNPADETTLTEYCLVRLNYGDSVSSAALEESIRSYIAPECRHQLASSILSHSRYIDDTLTSFKDHQERILIQDDIVEASSKANFLVKHTLYSGCDPVDEEQTPYTNVLAMRWFFGPDKLVSNTTFNTFPRKRGLATGKDLDEEIARTTPLTKTILCRLAGQSFSYTQAQLLPVTMCLRIAFSKVSTLTEEWHEDISDRDPEFTQLVRKMLESLTDVRNKMIPVQRAVCPEGYKPWRICVSSDGSSEAAAAIIHVLVTNGEDVRSTGVVARGKVVKDTVPNAELSGATIGTNMLKEFISVIPELQDQDIEIIFLTDSLCLCSSLNPAKLYKSVKVRNACFLIHKTIADLVARYPRVSVKYCHIRGLDNPSDGASKLVANPVAIANSDLWNFGPKFFKDPNWPPEEIVFISADNGSQTIYKPPQAQQHVEDNVNCIICHNTTDSCGDVSDTTPTSSQLQNNEPAEEGTSPSADDGNKDNGETPCEDDYTIDDEEQDAEFTTLPYEQYCRLIINSSSLMKVVNVVCLLIRLATFMGKKTRGSTTIASTQDNFSPQEKRAAWRVILRSSQKYFPPTNISSWFPYTNNNGIVKARTRYRDTETSKDIIQITSPPLISHRDHRLATLIVRHHHIKKIYPVAPDSPDVKPIHLPKNITLGNMRNSPYSVELTQVNRVIKTYINNCVQCIKLLSQPLQSALGTPRWLKFLQEQAIPYQIISIDPIGEYWYRQHPDSRGSPVKCWILVISCLITTATQCYIMQGSKKRDIYRALHNHFERFIPARAIYADAGGNVNLHPGDKDWNQLFGREQIDVIRIGTEEFHASFVESKIKILKKLIKSAMDCRKANKLPHMTITMLQDFFDTLCNLINSRPLFCTPDGKFMLSANALTKSWIYLDKATTDPRNGTLDTEIDNMEAQLCKLYDNLQTGSKTFLDSLKASLLSDTKNHKRLQEDSLLPRAGDVVLIARKDGPVLGIVEETTKPYSLVRRKLYGKYVSEKIHARKLHIIHRPYLGLDPPGQDKIIVELRKTRGILQPRVDKDDPAATAYVMAPHKFDDVILHPSHQYYCYSSDGRIMM